MNRPSTFRIGYDPSLHVVLVVLRRYDSRRWQGKPSFSLDQGTRTVALAAYGVRLITWR